MDYARRTSSFGNATFITLVISVAVLFLAREVLIPFAFAVLLGFLLAPLVMRLRHWGLGRFPSVGIVVGLFFLLIALISWFVTAQLVELASRLTEYQQNIQEKIRAFRIPEGGGLDRFSKTLDQIVTDLQAAGAPTADETVGEPRRRPVPVEIHEPKYSWQLVRGVLGSLAGPILTASIVLVLVIFILLQREDVRDRLIRLVGAGHLHITTQALDDAARRVSRYLLMQFVLNGSYGIAVGIGLYFMNVPSPALWGVLAVILRFVPFAGIWVAALMPAVIVFAAEPGWIKPAGILTLFFGLDVLAYNLIEPLLYGASTGISPLAILLAAVFWTWVWGPVGLLLATPLTVCLIVIGRYVPNFEFLSILLGDQPVLAPETRFYQRMLAMDVEEATEIAETVLEEKPLEELYDTLLIPALVLAEQDRHRGMIDESRQHFLLKNTRLLIDDIADRWPEIKARQKKELAEKELPDQTEPARGSGLVLCAPAGDEADALVGLMLARLLELRGVTMEVLPISGLVHDYVDEVQRRRPALVCISAVPPGAFMHARHLCKRLQMKSPELKIVVGLWNEKEERARARATEINGCNIVTTVRQAFEHILLQQPGETPTSQTADLAA